VGSVKEFWLYTGARFGIFGLVYAVIIAVYLVVTGDDNFPLLWPLLVAAVASAFLSTFLLRDLRQKVAGGVQARAERMSQRFEEMKAKEDTD